MKTLLVGLGIIAAGLMVAAPAAHAVPFAPVVFNLTSDHCDGGCGTPPFGTVTLIESGTTVDVTVHLNSPNQFVKTGAADFLAFKFNAVDVVLGDITVDAHIPALVAAAGAFNGDGTGEFDFGINCPTCGGGASTPFSNDIVFHVASATIEDLTVPNDLGNIFVADIIGSTGNTGPVDVTGGGGNGGGGGQGQVPGPLSLVLMGVGLAVFAVARRGFRHLG